ncbi:MAG: hypothetical protein RMJ15_01135 [Nitrososphaerota archaeon]|nr:hypothetical protein [Candidatus Bathyarchaeota archaeon]MDW8022338.1 hypothetical protein [Nitrososphaerota archaeon]
MVRRQVVPNEIRDKMYPICKSYQRNSWKKIARHIAMKGNDKLGEIHREWRIANGLLGDYETNREMIPEVMKIFGWQDC